MIWYRHHPKIHEMVSDRSSRAESWTDRRVFFLCACVLVRRIIKTHQNESTDDLMSWKWYMLICFVYFISLNITEFIYIQFNIRSIKFDVQFSSNITLLKNNIRLRIYYIINRRLSRKGLKPGLACCRRRISKFGKIYQNIYEM